jgi:hypothetical protein
MTEMNLYVGLIGLKGLKKIESDGISQRGNIILDAQWQVHLKFAIVKKKAFVRSDSSRMKWKKIVHCERYRLMKT